MDTLIGNEELSTNTNASQVYLATHDGAGKRLSHMNRSFISFTFGGKAIEDFGLIVVFMDKLERNAYASFSDSTTTYDTLDGQLYWGSKMEPNQIDFTLATDGITENQLDDFKEWFSPGKIRELFLSEHPNRRINARVASSPILSVLPFEKDITKKINGINYLTSTTIYKGEISLSLIMDEPFWHLKNNYMPEFINRQTLVPAAQLNSNNSNIVNSLEDKDMVKVMLEDNIPHIFSLSENMFLGGNLLVSMIGATTNSAQANNTNNAVIGPITLESEGLTISGSSPAYLFYSGNAKSYPTIRFSVQLAFVNNYATGIRNSITNTSPFYSYIKIGSSEMRFTTPSLLTSYNKVIALVRQSVRNGVADRINLLTQIRDTINDYYVRAWAVGCVNSIGDINSSNQGVFFTKMQSFIDVNTKVTFTVNSKTGEATGIFSIKILEAGENLDEIEYTLIEENVGDMICSNYLIIEGKNSLNSNGQVTAEQCKKITANTSFYNVLVFFENMYL